MKAGVLATSYSKIGGARHIFSNDTSLHVLLVGCNVPVERMPTVGNKLPAGTMIKCDSSKQNGGDIHYSCPRCGATFDCMHNDILSCHCATVRLDALQRTYLMENYSDCLCHDCLKAVKDSFYACEINPRYNKKKNDKESIDCKQR